MSSRNPHPDEDDLQSIAHDLLGMKLGSGNTSDEPLEIDGLGLDDLGFGLTPAEIKAEQEAAERREQERLAAERAEFEQREAMRLEEERQAELRNLLKGSRSSTETEISEPVPARISLSWDDQADDDEGFGSGLLDEIPPARPAAVEVEQEPAPSRKYRTRDREVVEPRAAEPSEKESKTREPAVRKPASKPKPRVAADDDFGSGIEEDLEEEIASEAIVDDDFETDDLVEDEAEHGDFESDPADVIAEQPAKPRKKDSYWDALEDWDWSESGSRQAGSEGRGEAPRGRKGGRKPDRDADRSRSAKPPRRQEPAAPREEHAEKPQRPAKKSPPPREEPAKPVRQKADSEQDAPRSRRGRRQDEPRPARPEPAARDRSDRDHVEEPKGRRQPPSEKKRRPEPPVRSSRSQIPDDDLDVDDFGGDVLEGRALEDDFAFDDEPETLETSGDTAETERKSRRRRGRRRKGKGDKPAPLPVARPEEDEDDFDSDFAPHLDDDLDGGDGFGSGLDDGGRSSRQERRPPRQERARRAPVEPPAPRSESRRPPRDREVSRPAEPVRSEPVEDKYKGIPSWEEAIGLLARKPPNPSGRSGDDRRSGGRSRGKRGGGGGNRPRRSS